MIRQLGRKQTYWINGPIQVAITNSSSIYIAASNKIHLIRQSVFKGLYLEFNDRVFQICVWIDGAAVKAVF